MSNQRKSGSFGYGAALAAAAVLIFPYSAVGQPAGDEALVEEVIVTAQKREQALKDVPMAVSAVTAEDIDAVGAVDVNSIQYLVPSLSISTVGGVGETMRIRAISPPGSLLPTVGRYVDEMMVNVESIGYGIDFPLVDLARVEVLKGPQGTLYGEGSIGGTLKYVTKSPTPGEVDGAFEVSGRTVNKGSEGIRAFAAGNLPIGGETFGLRLVGYWEDSPGWVDNAFGGKDANSRDRWFVRAKALWQPAESFEASLLYQHYENKLPSLEFSQLDYSSNYFIPYPNEVNYELANLRLNWDLGPVSVFSTTGYQHRTVFNSLDVGGYKAIIESTVIPGTTIRPFAGTTDWAPLFGNEILVPNPVANIGYSLDQLLETFSQEVRLSGQAGERLFWTLGGKYRDSKHDAPLFSEYSPDPEVIIPAGPLAGAPLPPALTGLLLISTEAWAVFGEASYAITPQLEATFGLRYYEDTRDATNITRILGGPFEVMDQVKNDNVALRIVLKYDFSEDLMAYASLSDGFRSGGVQFINTEAFGIGPNTFDPEELTTYEIGTKASLADGRLDFDASLFFTEYENVLVYTPNVFGVQAFNNGGEAEVLGFELESKLMIGEGLFLEATLGINDSQYTEPGFTHLKGEPMDGVPKYTYSLALDRRFTWWGNVGGHVRIDWFWEDEKETNARGFGYVDERPIAEGYKALNARVGWQFGNWSLYAFAENLTNDDAQLSVPFATLTEWVLSQPRTVGLTLRSTF